MKQVLKKEFNRDLVHARWAHITDPQPVHLEQGRENVSLEIYVCADALLAGISAHYLSTIPWAEKTGNLTIQTDAVVHSILYDANKKRAIGVRVIDAHTKQTKEFYAKIIFVNASALNTNLILLNSKSERFPNGLGNDSGLLGKYICHHNYRAYLNGKIDGFMDQYYAGRNPHRSYYCQL